MKKKLYNSIKMANFARRIVRIAQHNKTLRENANTFLNKTE